MNKVLKLILNYFFKGVLILVPIFFSVYVIYYVIKSIDGIVNIGIPGAGILIVLTGFTIVGALVTSFITEPIFNYFDRLLNRMPFFKMMYSSIRDLLEAFVGEEKKFNEPVTVLDDSGLKQIGFLTQRDLSNIGLPGDVAVYFPFSYSFAGRVMIVPKDKVSPLAMKSSDAMKFVLSGGVTEIE
ncbi:MAG: hypothetical protein RI952_1155 [Bacteroidota bacterium]|jgi:uncharacterized membrane protein